MKRAALLAAFGIAAISASVACTTLLGDFDVTQTPADSGVTADSGPAKGTACTTADECGTGFCVDGVCCEAACDGVCEKCNLPGTEGTCAPVPDGQNPDNECATEPLVIPEEDAGTGDDAGDGGDAGDPDAGPPADAGPIFNLPDGGQVTTEQNQCAGSCNGQRACKFPSTERTCGTVVCGNETQQGRASCDGKGHCLFGVETCQAYTCPDGNPGCKASCSGPSDCQDGFFCDSTGVCKAQLNNGVTCATGIQCQTGYCVDGVCCSDACNTPGGTCAKAGSVGTCACNECANGPCRLWYKDADGDGYGDKNGTVALNTAKPGCVAGPAPAGGFVDNNTDCFDGAPGVATNVHPGQTAFFGTPYTGPAGASFDYDCSGGEDRETPEYPGATCHFCGYSKFFFGCTTPTTCTTVGTESGLACRYGKGSCSTVTTPGFTVPVACGANGYRYTCGTCNGSGISGTTGSTVQQRCH